VSSGFSETAGYYYAQFIADQLAEERKRKESFEARGITVVTTSGVLVSLLLGLAAFARADSSRELSAAAVALVVVSLPCFVVGAVLAIVVNFPRGYEEPDATLLTRLTTVELWSAAPLHATRRMAHSHARTLAKARAVNTEKGRLLFAALTGEVAGVTLAAAGVAVVLLNPYLHGMSAPRILVIVGLGVTLLGALVLSWYDLRGGIRGKATMDAVERGMPRTGAARIGFPLIVVGTVLQIFGAALG
jgi:hypothetical protein